jgi:hypothetical protein
MGSRLEAEVVWTPFGIVGDHEVPPFGSLDVDVLQGTLSHYVLADLAD